ncbi:hypothetical protein D3C81_1597980 [compost metagenome]
MLGRASGQFVQAPRRGLQFDALVAFAFGDLLAPHENPRPRTLRAGVTAPDPAGEHGDGEQAERGNDQQRGKQDEILRPERRAEDVEFAFGKVPEHRLTSAPIQPHGAEKQHEQKSRATHAQGAEQTGEAAGVDQVVAGFGRRLHWTCGHTFDSWRCFYGSDGDLFAHGYSLISLHQARAL